MCSLGNQNLSPFDPNIETTTRKQSGATTKKKAKVVMAGKDARVLRDYALPNASRGPFIHH